MTWAQPSAFGASGPDASTKEVIRSGYPFPDDPGTTSSRQARGRARDHLDPFPISQRAIHLGSCPQVHQGRARLERESEVEPEAGDVPFRVLDPP